MNFFIRHFHKSVQSLLSVGLLAVLLVTASDPARAASSGPVERDHIVVELVSEQRAARAGESFRVGLSMQHAPNWHTYWKNPGDSGLQTRFDWQLPEGAAAGSIQWPYPERIPVEHLVNYGYSDHILLPADIRVPSDWPEGQDFALQLTADWLICEVECIPGKAELSMTIPVDTASDKDEAEPSTFAGRFAEIDRRIPTPVAWPARFNTDGDQLGLQIEPDASVQAADLIFFPAEVSLVEHAAEPFIAHQAGFLQIAQPLSPFFRGAPESLSLVLVDQDNQRAFELTAVPDNLQSVAPTTVESRMPLILIVLLAIAGGVLLNLMPCVFPVLSLKAMSLVSSADHNPRGHGLAYTLGILLSFAVLAGILLALRAAGEAIGWGFQLQSPWFIGALVYLLFLMALSLSGVFEFGTRWMGLGQGLTEQQGLRGSFFTGVLATLVASPCTAPFMGTALGVAITLPALQALLVFLGLGFGLALPMLLLSLIPALARWLPRPGAWMETFKQAMAFPLYLTVVWLLWVLARQTGADALAAVLLGMVMLAFAAWLGGRPEKAGSLNTLRHSAVGLSLIVAVMAVVAAERSNPEVISPEDVWWQPWSASTLAEINADPNRGALVNMTADWCVTCLVNERIALSHDDVRATMEANDIVYLKGDWTRRDDAITEYLAQYGRNGVPLYVYYPPGDNPGEPEVLPQILTPGLVIGVLDPVLNPSVD